MSRNEIVPKVLIPIITRQQTVALWPIRLPGDDGRSDDWSRSALEAIPYAQDQWIRLKANQSLGAYEIDVAEGDLGDPEWPATDLDGLLALAFKGEGDLLVGARCVTPAAGGTMIPPTSFAQLWCLTFRYCRTDGERPTPVCAVAYELRSGQIMHLWQDELHRIRQPPYAVGPESVTIAYHASAALCCHLALGWPLPAYVLDLYTEFRLLTNGVPTPCGDSLLGALTYCGHRGDRCGGKARDTGVDTPGRSLE